MGIKMSPKILVVFDCYVMYEEAEVHRSAIMQDFRDNEKKIKWPTGGHFRFYNCEICHELIILV